MSQTITKGKITAVTILVLLTIIILLNPPSIQKEIPPANILPETKPLVIARKNGTVENTHMLPNNITTEPDTDTDINANNNNAGEIPIDIPPLSNKADYTFSLVRPDTGSGEYILKVCSRSGETVQQLPCGNLTEPVTFLYDGLAGDVMGLEIFSADSQTGLAFVRNYEPKCKNFFYENAIEIPKYEEVRQNGFMSSTSDNEFMENTVYQLNLDTNKAEQVRKWILSKNTGNITVWDCLGNQIIYEGQADLDTDGNLVNNEYYQHLLWDNLYRMDDYTADSTLAAWMTVEYENSQAFLEEFGFADTEPIYHYYDNCHNPRLELYMDKTTGKGCGIVHRYRYNYQLEKIDYVYGFAFDSVEEAEWQEINPYHLETATGKTASDETDEFNEIFEYTADGSLDYYKAQGYVSWLHAEDEERQEGDADDFILDIDYIYRDDGTLFYKEYRHNATLFSTSFQIMDAYYDELGRILYEYAYITHGNYEYYYIYEDKREKPAYRLVLDYNMGYYLLSEITRFR